MTQYVQLIQDYAFHIININSKRLRDQHLARYIMCSSMYVVYAKIH